MYTNLGSTNGQVSHWLRVAVPSWGQTYKVKAEPVKEPSVNLRSLYESDLRSFIELNHNGLQMQA